MIDENTKKAKIAQFLNDIAMCQAVYEELLDSFLKPGPTDVQTLAASRLSIDFLKKGWKDLMRFRSENEQEAKEVTNFGV